MSEETDVEPDYRKPILGAAAFILGVGAILFFFGPTWMGVFVALITVLAVEIVRRMALGSSDERPDDWPEPGAECPHCGAMKTDYVTRFADDGSDYETLHCFECERDLGTDLDEPSPAEEE